MKTKTQASETTEKAGANLTPKDLVSKLGISEKRVRMLLRKDYPRERKGGQWQITPELAKTIVKAYRAKEKAKEAERKLRIEKQLSGTTETSAQSDANDTKKAE